MVVDSEEEASGEAVDEEATGTVAVVDEGVVDEPGRVDEEAAGNCAMETARISPASVCSHSRVVIL